MDIQINTHRMMTSRGYEFVRKEDNEIYIYKNSEEKNIIIFFYDSDKLNIDAIKDFIILLERFHINHGIIIYNGSVTSSTKKVLEHLHKFRIELFAKKEFKYCLIDHEFYCPHRKLSVNEALEIKNSFGTNLPILIRTDAVARFFSFNKNDIIEITRKNNSIAYRIVK